MTPIRRGTAARLGLRPARPRFKLRFGHTMSDEEIAEFRRAFREAARQPVRLLDFEYVPPTLGERVRRAARRIRL